MFFNKLVVTAGLVAAVLAIDFSGPYCGNGEIPNTADCQAGMALIDPTRTYDNGQLIWSGDCALSISSTVITQSTRIKGQDWLNAVNNMVANRCANYRGWDIISGTANVSAYQCRSGGGFGVKDQPCNSPPMFVPGHHRRYVELQGISSSQDVSKPRERAHSARAARDLGRGRAMPALSQRSLGPAEGYVCGGYIGVKTDSCNAIADSLRGQSWTIPFTTGDNDGCYFGLMVKSLFSVNTAMDGNAIADIITKGMDKCQNDGIIGDVTYNPGENIAYTAFFGQLCGAFGSGIGDCGNSGGQR